MKKIDILFSVVCVILLMLVMVGMIQGFSLHYILIMTSVIIVAILTRLAYYFFMSCLGNLWQSIKNYTIEKYHEGVCFAIDFLKTKRERWRLEELPKGHISLLSPTVDFSKHKEYVQRLKGAIDKADVYNVALTGTYGSGKSSIIKTFKAYYPKFRYANVSLASFVEAKPEKIENGDECEDSFEEQLEYSILQQLFYQVRARKIPESRFGRIERSSLKRRMFAAIALFLFIASILNIFWQKPVGEHFHISEDVLNSPILFGLSVICFLLGIILLCLKLVLYVKKVSIKKLTLDKAALEFEEKKNVSIMNRYLDEIIYLFQEKKYDIVVFEDIDRFDNTHIFTKLRELNLILNQSEEIGRRIVFLYALKDDVFANAEERTKFFDFIVPVIPYVNVSNSGDLFRRKIAELNIPEDEVSSSFITDISAFVNDMRVLTNVVNEFDLYRNLLDPKLKKKKLLAMILYKNLYPTDFSLLHQNKGVVYETFMSADMLRNELQKDDRVRLEEIDSEIQAINEENLKSIEELHAVIIGKFMKLWPGEDWDVYYKGSIKSISDLYSEKYVHLIINGEVGFKSQYNYTPRYFSSEEVKNVLGKSFDYDKRKDLVESGTKAKIESLQEKRKAYMDEISVIGKYTLLDIAKSDKDIFNHVEIPDGQVEKYKVLKYLLEKGYVDEKYFFYISIFQEGRLTPSDQDFLLSIKFNSPKESNYHLQEIPSLMQSLSILDYDNKGILNFDLLGYCLEHKDDYKDKCDAILKQLMAHDNYIDLIYQYLQEGKNISRFINRLLYLDKNIWKALDQNIAHTDKSKDEVLALIFMYANITDIKQANLTCPMNTYINERNNYPALFNNVNTEKVKELLGLLELKVRTLVDDSDGANTYDLIYQNHMFELTLENVKVIFKHENLSTVELDSSAYTSIGNTDLDDLRLYVKEELPVFIQNVMLFPSNTEEAEDAIADVVCDTRISVEDGIKLIKHNNAIWNNCHDIVLEEILQTLFSENKVKMTMNNLLHYCSSFGNWQIDDTLAKFMNKNEERTIQEITKQIELEDEHQIELFQSIVNSNKINDNIVFSIFNNRCLFNLWNNNLTLINETRIRYIIENNLISVSPNVYQEIVQVHPSLKKLLLCQKPEDVITNWDEYNLGAKTTIDMLEWNEYVNKQDFLLSKVDNENVDSSVADALLVYFSNSDKHFDLRLYAMAMEKSNNQMLKIMSSTSCIGKRLIALSELPKIFAKSGEEFQGLEKQGEIFSVSKHLDGINEFMDTLNKIRYIGKVKDGGDNLIAKVRTHK